MSSTARSGAVTIVDVTDPRAPKASEFAQEFARSSDSPPLHVGEVAGTAALFTGTHPMSRPQAPETVMIVSFADPAHPKIVQQFSHVACLLKVKTYLANQM